MEVGHYTSSASFVVEGRLGNQVAKQEVLPRGDKEGSIRLPSICTFSNTASPALWVSLTEGNGSSAYRKKKYTLMGQL